MGSPDKDREERLAAALRDNLRRRKAQARAAETDGDKGGPMTTSNSEDLSDWRGEALANVRRLIHEAEPKIVEERKWAKPSNPSGVPTWSRDGIVCTGETYRDKVKLTFAQGASLDDPSGLFNASLEGGTRRAIDIREGEEVDGEALKALVREAAAFNGSKGRRR